MRQFGRFGALVRRTLAYVAAAAIAVTAAVAVPPGGRDAVAAPVPLPVLVDDIVQRTSPTYNAWRSLEAEARETVAAMRNVPNDTRLAWFARDEIRAVMFARLVRAIQEQASGATLSPNEAAWVAATTDLVRARRVAAARSALDEYDRWFVDPCSYQPPAGYGFKQFAPCGAGLGALFDPLAPSADQFTAYGTALVTDAALLGADAKAAELAAVQALTLLGGVSGALLAGAAAGSLALLVPAVATAVAIALGTYWGGFAGFAATAAVFSSSVLATGVGIAVLAAVVTAIGIWQLVLSEQVRPTLVDRIAAAQNTPIDLAFLTSNDGLGELFPLFLGQTLPDQAAERAAAITPTAFDAVNDPQFLDVDTGVLVPQIRTLDWNGTPQTTYISGRWFVTRSDGGSFEWDATLQFRGGDGLNASAIIGPNGFVSAQRTSDTTFVARNSNQLWVSDADNIGVSRSYTFSGNTPPSITAIRRNGNPTRPDFQTLFEGERLVFGVTASDPDAGDLLTTTWYLPPDGGGAFTEACTPADGSLDPLFRCQWNVSSGMRVDPTYTRSGTYFGRVRVEDSRGAFDEQWFTFTVVNVAPTLVVDQPAGSTITVSEGTPVTFSGTSSDPGDDQLRITIDWGDGTIQRQSYPCVGPVAADGTCTASIFGAASDPTSWTRTRTYPRPGTYTVTITADDFQGGSTSTTRQVVVPASTVSVDQPFVTTNGSSVELVANIRSFGDIPYRVTVDWGDGTTTTADFPCTGPTCAFGGAGPGGGVIALCIFLGQRCTWFNASHTYAVSGDYTITVTPSRPAVGLTFDARTTNVQVVNTAPTAFFNPSQPCPPGGLVICLPVPDPDTRDALVGSAVRLRGQVVDNTINTVTGTIDWGDGTPVETVTLVDTPTWNGACTLMSPCPPNARFFDVSHVYAAAGEYTVTFVADDGDGGITTITTTVVVRANGSPIVVNDVIRTTEDVSVFAFALTGLLTNDSDPERDPLTVTAFTQPANGTVNVNPDGSWFFTPAPNANGTSTFTYTVSDGRTSSTGTVTVEITPANDPPVATGPVSFAVFEDGTLCLFGCPTVLDRFRDVDGDALVAELVTPPANGTLSPALAADGTFGYVPAANRSGSDSFVFRVCERDRPTVCTVPVTATIDITSVNDAPSFVAGPSQTVTTRGTTVTVPGWATAISPGPADESGQQVTFSVVTDNPALFAADGAPAVSADGTLTFRPIAAGSTQVRVTAVDDGPGLSAPNENRSAPQVITISIGASADLSLTSSTNDPVLPGGTGEVRLVVANGGPDASSAVVRVELPAGLELVTPAPAGFDAVTSRWSVGSVPSGSSSTLTLGVRMRDTGSTTVVAEIVSAAVSDPDSTPGNGTANGEDDHSSVTVTRRTPLADLRMTDQVGLRVASTPVVAGGDVTGLVGITNDGPQDTVAQVRVGLDGLSLRPGAPVPSGYSTTTGIWTVSVPSGTSRSIELPLTAARVGTLTITGEVVGSTIGDPDSTPGNGAVAGEDDRATASATAISRFALRFSTSNLRTAPVLLDGATVSGSIAVFVPTSTDIDRVDFFLNDPTMSGARRQVERSAPWDFGGTATGDRATMFSTRTLADGPNTITARVVLRNGTTQVVTATFTVSNPRPATRRLMVSTQGNRSAALPLDGRSVSGSLAVFVPDEAGIVLVEFRLDGRLIRTEFARPWDFGSTLGNGNAALVRFSPGSRTVTARIVFSDGSSDTLRAVFTAT
jgi:VCBS repeat-containing protein